jgi:hypothetical protein
MGMPFTVWFKSSNNKMELQGESLVWPFVRFTSVNISCMLLLSRLYQYTLANFLQKFCGLFISYFIIGWVNTFSVLPHINIVTSLQRSVITSGIGHQRLESVRDMTRGHLGKQWAHGHVHTQKGASNVLSKYYFFHSVAIQMGLCPIMGACLRLSTMPVRTGKPSQCSAIN